MVKILVSKKATMPLLLAPVEGIITLLYYYIGGNYILTQWSFFNIIPWKARIGGHNRVIVELSKCILTQVHMDYMNKFYFIHTLHFSQKTPN